MDKVFSKIKNMAKNRIKHSVIYPYLPPWLPITDPITYKRRSLWKFLYRLQKNPLLANDRWKITPNRDCVLTTIDNINIFYNLDSPQHTFGDAQSLDIFEPTHPEPAEIFLMNSFESGAVYFDIGANNGYFYSLKLAKKNPNTTIFAFEPDPKVLLHLYKNIELNNLTNTIQVHTVALCNQNGIQNMTADLGASGYLLSNNTSNNLPIISIQSITLDSFIENNQLTKIDFIKVDIEGGEFEFLKGASNCLTHLKPTIILELDDKLLSRNNASTQDIHTFLQNHHYQLLRFSNTRDAIAFPEEKAHFTNQIAQKFGLSLLPLTQSHPV